MTEEIKNPLSRTNTRCSRCGQTGHRAYDRKFHPEVGFYKCTICGESGHNSRFHDPDYNKDMTATEKKCRICGETKLIEEFQLIKATRPNGRIYTTRSYMCKECSKIRCKKYNKIFYKRLDGRLLYFFHSGRAKCRDAGMDFNITVAYLQDLLEKQDYKCYYTGLPLEVGKENVGLSLDRIDSTKGYIEGNVAFTMGVVNRIKSSLELPYFIHLCRLIVEHTKDMELGEVDISSFRNIRTPVPRQKTS